MWWTSPRRVYITEENNQAQHSEPIETVNNSFSEPPNTGTDFSGVLEQSCIVDQSSGTGTLSDATNHTTKPVLKSLETVPTVTNHPENAAIQPPHSKKKI